MAQTGDPRPSPDALLDLASRERRGRLKVFLGAAPGVGKTYAMLSGARRLKDEGRDVIVGIVETHGRKETASLLEGLEILPRRTVTYRDRQLMEFDLDAALARRPELIVVDELAHSNLPESRHPKRYQDVEELLDAGIDVWTALNIQHVESLSDVVSGITGVTMREVVPDTVIERADDVVVVDITPDELLERLRDGKVYLPESAGRAVDNYFKLGNLTALRELALRRTADRVDDQMVNYLRRNAIEGPWPTAERLLVCVGADHQSEAVVRTASRLAGGLNATWVAVHLEEVGRETQDAGALKRINAVLALAERLGAETTRLVARDLPAEVLRFARRENITQIVLGRSRSSWLKRLLRRSLSDEIMRRAAGLAIHVITPEHVAAERFQWPRPVISLGGYAASVVSVAAAVALGKLASHWLQLPNLSMVFLAAVLFAAITFGIWSAILAALLSFLAYDFFFIEPFYTFSISSPHEFLALIVFLAVAILTGGLAGRVREQAIAARRRAQQTQLLFDFSRKLSGTPTLDDVLWAAASQIASAIEGEAVILLDEEGELVLKAAFPPDDRMGPSEWTAGRWARDHQELAGLGSTTLPHAHYQFRPLPTSRGVAGIIGLRPGGKNFGAEIERLADALIGQAAVAIERTLLSVEAAKAEAAAESERLRSSLLSSISHDLRTPLATLLGAVTSLRSFGSELPDESRQDLLSAIEEETRRMSRFISNLLDMTRLESRIPDVRREWVDLSDVARAAIERARKTWPSRVIEFSVPLAPLPPIKADSGLLEQLVFNLLDNANKYTELATPTVVRLDVEPGALVLRVADQGKGIPPDDLERVFDKFYRARQGDGRESGIGLGLAICRSIVTALGGTITAVSPPVAIGHGTTITTRLPLSPRPAT